MKRIIIAGSLFFLIVVFLLAPIQENINVPQTDVPDVFKPLFKKLYEALILEGEAFRESGIITLRIVQKEGFSTEDLIEFQTQLRMFNKISTMYEETKNNFYDFVVEIYKKYEN